VRNAHRARRKEGKGAEYLEKKKAMNLIILRGVQEEKKSGLSFFEGVVVNKD